MVRTETLLHLAQTGWEWRHWYRDAETQAAIWCGIIVSKGMMPARFERAADGTIRLHNGATKPLFGDWT